MLSPVSLPGRVAAAIYGGMNARFERAHGAEMRRRQLAPANGRVLEISGGTGANLAHYPDTVDELVVTELDDGMRRRAERRERDSRPATLLKAPAERLPFPDASRWFLGSSSRTSPAATKPAP